MHEFSLSFLRCPRCNLKVDCDVFFSNKEIEEGFIHCSKCNSLYPIIKKIPIIWNDFKYYISARPSLGGILYNYSDHPQMKKFLKKSLLAVKKSGIDQHKLEKHWLKIYQNNSKSKFYNVIRKKLNSINSKLSLEYGCSIGLITESLAETSDIAFGIDRSFSAIEFAKKTNKKNLDYFVADSMSNVFGKNNFDLIVALNILELIEPTDFIKKISNQIKNGFLVISDPYDYDRGIGSVKIPLNENQIRSKLREFKFQITKDTENPSFIPWTLKINPRTSLNYSVDLVIAKK